MSADQREALEERRPTYVDQILDTGIDNVLDKLVKHGVVTGPQYRVILEERGCQKQAELLVDILMCRPLTSIAKIKGSLNTQILEMPEPICK